jgi:hypothetical protein
MPKLHNGDGQQAESLPLSEAVAGRSWSRTPRTTSSTAALIYVPSRLLTVTSPDSVWNRVITGADVLIVDRPLQWFVASRHCRRRPELVIYGQRHLQSEAGACIAGSHQAAALTLSLSHSLSHSHSPLSFPSLSRAHKSGRSGPALTDSPRAGAAAALAAGASHQGEPRRLARLSRDSLPKPHVHSYVCSVSVRGALTMPSLYMDSDGPGRDRVRLGRQLASW